MLQTIINNAQLLIVLAFVVLSLLGGVFRKVQEQREVQRRKAALERARLEMLRTGRGIPTGEFMPGPTETVFQSGPAPVGPPTSAAEALARLEEIARRRQEQMGKVRTAGPPKRRESEQTAPAGPVIVMSPSGPIVLRPGTPGPGMPVGGAGVPAGRKGKQSRQGQRPKAPRPGPRPAPEEPAFPAPALSAIEQARAVPPTPVPEVAVRGRTVMPGGAPRTPEEWRRLAVATTIFGRPVSEDPGDGSPPRMF